MNINELKDSKFLKRADVGEGTTVTITHLEQVNVAKEGAPEDLKWAIHFKEFEKAMVLNSTNGQLIAQFLGSEESDNWTGKQIVVYDDPTVSYGGKLIGGIRVRAVPRGAASPSRTVSGTPAAGGSAKAELKAKFKAHPEFNKTLLPDRINEYLVGKFGVKLDALSEQQARDAIADFDYIVEAAIETVPF